MSKSNFLVRVIAFAAILTSMGIVLKIFSITTPYFRISLFDAMIILAGLLLGPWWGLAIGFSVDVIEYMMFSDGYAFSVIICLGTMMTGFIPGVMVRLNKRLFGTYKLGYTLFLLTITLSTLVAFTFTSIYMFIWYRSGLIANLPTRIITMLIKWPLYFILLRKIYERIYTYSLELQDLND